MAKPLHILIVEDSEDDTQLLIRHLQKNGIDVDFRRVESDKAMRAALEDEGAPLDIILCDYRVPGFTAEAALKLRSEIRPEVPVIIVSGVIGEERAIALAKFGATDLILKGNLSRLVPAIEREIEEAAIRHDKKRADDLLVESEQRFRSLFEGSSQGFMVHRDFKPIQANAALAIMFGYGSPDEILGLSSTLELYAPADRARVERYHRARLKGEPAPLEYELTGLKKDGSEFWLNNRAFRIDWPGGPAICSTLFDITEQKRSEISLRESEERVKTIVENSPLLISLVDKEGRYLLINRQYEREIGIERDQIKGRTPHDIYSTEYAEAAEADIRQIITTKRPIEREETLTLAGKVQTYHVIKFPILDAAGNVNQIGSLATNITERKHAEEEKKNLDLQMHQMKKMDSLGRLASGVAHEFNNMLVPVIGLTGLVLEDLPEESEIYPNLQMVLEGAERACGLAKQILSFSHMQERSVEPVVLDEVVGEAIDMLRTTLPSTIKISTDLDTGGVKVLCDPLELHQVIMNLGANAANAMKAGKGTLSFSLDKMDVLETRTFGDGILMLGPYARLIVRDTGCGMDQETASRIFEPFFTTKDVGEGTGLGLSAVYGIIVAYGGNIRVESEPGKGTTFEIFIPIPSEDELARNIDGGAEDISE